MIYREKEIFKFISNYIKSSKKSYIVLKELYGSIQSSKPTLFKYIMTREGYLQLHSVIQKLCEEGFIIPTKSKDSNGMTPPLKNKYRKVEKKEDYENTTFEMMNLNQKINIGKFYLKRPKEYINDKKEISIINDFLNNPLGIKLTLHERSWQLFGDEKYLKNPGKKSDGEILLQNLGITLDDLNCYYAYEPFIYFENTGFGKKEKRNILIVENKDTFWSFHNILFDELSTLDIDMLIYGEGNKINSSLQYGEKLGVTAFDTIWYFGDIDREGLNIFLRLKERYESYDIKLRVELYELLLNLIDIDKTSIAKNKQKPVKESLEVFLDGMQYENKARIQEIIDINLYIPQEVLNYEVLSKMYLRSDS